MARVTRYGSSTGFLGTAEGERERERERERGERLNLSVNAARSGIISRIINVTMKWLHRSIRIRITSGKTKSSEINEQRRESEATATA